MSGNVTTRRDFRFNDSITGIPSFEYTDPIPHIFNRCLRIHLVDTWIFAGFEQRLLPAFFLLFPNSKSS